MNIKSNCWGFVYFANVSLVFLVVMFFPIDSYSRDYLYQDCGNDGATDVFDFSPLNNKIGNKDFVQVFGDSFYVDGRPIKFWGVNWISPTYVDVRDLHSLAKRFKALGVNLVRLHNVNLTAGGFVLDDKGGVETSGVVKLDKKKVSDFLEIMDVFGEYGIYVSVTLINGFNVSLALSEGGGKLSRPMARFLGVSHPTAIQGQFEYIDNLLGHLNPDDRAGLAMLEINNEYSLIYALDRGLLTGLSEIKWLSYLEAPWRKFLEENGIATISLHEVVRGDYKNNKIFRLFLNELDSVYFSRLIGRIRARSGRVVPTVGTQANFLGGDFNRIASNFDYIDLHGYVDHYVFPNARWSPVDWYIRDEPLGKGVEELFRIFNGYSRFSKPISISEYNQPWPSSQGAAIPLYAAVLASVYNFDSVVYFSWLHGDPKKKVFLRGFEMAGDCSRISPFALGGYYFRHLGDDDPGRLIDYRGSALYFQGKNLAFYSGHPTGSKNSDLIWFSPRSGDPIDYGFIVAFSPVSDIFNSSDFYIGIVRRAFRPENGSEYSISSALVDYQPGDVKKKTLVNTYDGRVVSLFGGKPGNLYPRFSAVVHFRSANSCVKLFGLDGRSKEVFIGEIFGKDQEMMFDIHEFSVHYSWYRVTAC